VTRRWVGSDQHSLAVNIHEGDNAHVPGRLCRWMLMT
jgi:hypothetical protein